MTTVYAVTAGSYSDFHIEALFSTEKVARQAADSLEYGGGEVAEYTVYDEIPPKRIIYHMEALPVTKEPTAGKNVLDGWKIGDGYVSGHARPDGTPVVHAWAYGSGRGPKNRALRVWGYDKAKVEKVFQDQRAQMLAVIAGVADA